jgi:hypothetical protein
MRENPIVISTRKIERNKLRAKAERKGFKASRYVRRMFDRLQIKKYGDTVRSINQAKGTHKRETWRQRIASVID